MSSATHAFPVVRQISSNGPASCALPAPEAKRIARSYRASLSLAKAVARLARFALLLALAVFAIFGCRRLMPVDTTPLDAAGLSYTSIQQLKALKITTPEVAEIAKASRGGLSDAGCVQMTQIFHGRAQVFNVGDAVAGLVHAGVAESTVLQLAQLNQLGVDAANYELMHLAGLSDPILLEVARRHAQRQTVLSGASLARLKNWGLSESTLLELAHRGVPDSQVDAIISSRRRGAKDAAILRSFTGS